MKSAPSKKYSRIIFLFFLILTAAAWFSSRHTHASWINIPPPPVGQKAALFALGDKQLAYRWNYLMLQNAAYGLARDIPFDEYNYNNLKKWFFLQDSLDPISDATPMLAAYFYGAVKAPDKLAQVIDYLAHAGQMPVKEKWRWLAQGVYLARYEMQDLDYALELSYSLAANKNPNLADWAHQMPAFILAEQGRDKAAYQIMLNILASRHKVLHPSEVYYMQDHICNMLLPKIPDEPRPLFCNSIEN